MALVPLALLSHGSFVQGSTEIACLLASPEAPEEAKASKRGKKNYQRTPAKASIAFRELFRHWRADPKTSPQEPLVLRQMTIYTIPMDAGLEVKNVEVLGSK